MIPFICFILLHTAPASHCADFYNYLVSKGYKVDILATGPALAKLPQAIDFNPTHRALDTTLAQEIAKKCVQYDLVITDMGDPFMQEVHTCIDATKTRHYAYYDNPEGWVPGGYSLVAEKIADSAQAILFANRHLAKKPLFAGKKSFGIGYYNFAHAQDICEKRALRSPSAVQTLVYFGGNNEEYFTQAFPQFLHLLQKIELKNSQVLLQQHPGAKKCSRELEEMQKYHFSFPVTISNKSIDEVLVEADAAIYFQTSMNVEFLAIGIPQIIQIGKRPIPDLLVASNWASQVTTADELCHALQRPDIPQVEERVLYDLVGYSPHWPQHLEEAMRPLPNSIKG